MVHEAEKYKDEGEKQWNKVTSKNSLEFFVISIKATAQDKKCQVKLNDYRKHKILLECNKIISWLDKYQAAIKEEFECQQLNKVCSFVITKLFQSAGSNPGGMPRGSLVRRSSNYWFLFGAHK